MNTRRQFLIRAPLGVLVAAAGSERRVFGAPLARAKPLGLRGRQGKP